MLGEVDCANFDGSETFSDRGPVVRPSDTIPIMQPTMTTIEDEIRKLKRDESLLFLNHVLSVSRGHTNDPQLATELAKLRSRPLGHVIHFLSKQLLLHSSIVGRFVLDWPRFIHLMNMQTALEDAIQHDPKWKHANPAGLLERLLAQQLPSQDRKIVQKYGLGLGLFRDVGPITWPKRYDLPNAIETELGMSVERFMAIGNICGLIPEPPLLGNVPHLGRFTSRSLTEAFDQGLRVCVPEIYGPFLQRVACNRDAFRILCQQEEYKATDPLYAQFEFNPLFRFPITELGPNNYLTVDYELVVRRTTLGLFYDLFERHRTNFSEFLEPFGHVFDKFVGMLLASVSPSQMLWSSAAWEESTQTKIPGKVCDRAYLGPVNTILLECKSLRPTLKLTTYGAEDSVEKFIERIAEAMTQLIGHDESIQAGLWARAGIPQRPTAAFVIVTYGQFYTANTPFIRNRVVEQLQQVGLQSRPFVILSLEDLDSVVRLIEIGHSFDEIILRLSGPVASLNDYPELAEHAISRFSIDRGTDFLQRLNTIK